MTIWAAKSVFQEKERGSLEVEKMQIYYFESNLMKLMKRYFKNKVLETLG